MPTAYDAAVETLYRGPVDTFVAERKRLANELRAAGDKQGAARLGKLGRPSISAWAVNQLWWHERKAFERLFAAAEEMKKGKRDAAAEHREALAALRALAAGRLVSAGHAAPEATMRRVTLTLSAIAVTGSFDPDPPGALAADRDPPGFDVFGLAPAGEEPGADAGAEQRRIEEEHRRREEEQARKKAEHDKLTRELTAAQSEVAALQREADRLRRELRGIEENLEKAQAHVEQLRERLQRVLRPGALI